MAEFCTGNIFTDGLIEASDNNRAIKEYFAILGVMNNATLSWYWPRSVFSTVNLLRYLNTTCRFNPFTRWIFKPRVQQKQLLLIRLIAVPECSSSLYFVLASPVLVLAVIFCCKSCRVSCCRYGVAGCASITEGVCNELKNSIEF